MPAWGEMISQLPTGVKVPSGFATTAHAFREFLKLDNLAERISRRLAALDTEDVRAQMPTTKWHPKKLGLIVTNA